MQCVTSLTMSEPVPIEDISGVKSFDELVFERVLNDIPESRMIFCVCEVRDKPGKAVVQIIKQHMTESECKKLFTSQPASFQTLVHHNHKYYSFFSWCDPSLNQLTVKVIYPASDYDIKKYAPQDRAMVRETPEDYRNITMPYIETIPRSRIGWIDNILDGQAEADKILCQDEDPVTGFVVAPDTKWDGRTPESIYLLGIARARTIPTLRDLQPEHHAMLLKMRESTQAVLFEKFGVPADHIFGYVHYLPSFYHFHVHFVHIARPMASAAANHAIPLDDVIDNLARNPEYYREVSLTMVIGAENPLYERYGKKAPEPIVMPNTTDTPDANESPKPTHTASV
eukprot:gnl/Trimastix_PCT/4147.p1 GENE.gnl/Trimastix_PCT/4147~~gnl/Trimastix_PCT/4147.p1  ORF type:complete len:341 (-),score=100.15 gnl/Trimastix_PCT/4147:36-1058(-)